MAAKAINLLEPKWPTEANKTNDPKCSQYHKVNSYPIKECYVFKDTIKDMIRTGEIEIEGAPNKLVKGSQRCHYHLMWSP